MTTYPDTGALSAPAEGTLLITNVRPYGEGEPTNVLIKDGVIASLGTTNEATEDLSLIHI